MSTTVLNITCFVNDGSPREYDGVAIFHDNGGEVALEGVGVYPFKTVGVEDKGNFLSAFMSKYFDHEYVVVKNQRFYNITRKEEKNTERTVFAIKLGDGIYTFPCDDPVSNIWAFIEHKLTLHDLRRGAYMKAGIKFCNNEKINAILNYNQVTPEQCERYNLTTKLNLALGSEEFNTYLDASVYNETCWRYQGQKHLDKISFGSPKNTLKIIPLKYMLQFC